MAIQRERILYAIAAVAILSNRSVLEGAFSNVAETTGDNRTLRSLAIQNEASVSRPGFVVDSCTDRQKEIVWNQTAGVGGRKRISVLNRLTKCPDSSNWLDQFHLQDHQPEDMEPFLAINVGCNKGYDSLKLLRMGTRDASIQSKPWEEASFIGAVPPACKAKLQGDLPLPENSSTRRGDVYCIEPMPATIRALQKASETNGMEQKGLHIVHAAIANENGTAQFPEHTVGVETDGLGAVKRPDRFRYMDVPLMTLDEFGKIHLQSHGRQTVNVLLIDVEGFDFDVILGAKETLEKLEYLEFEYNSIGKWQQQTLENAINFLDERDFTCYWAGVRKLWRVTKCWQGHFEHRQWSNLACVHNKKNPALALKMENVFLETIGHVT